MAWKAGKLATARFLQSFKKLTDAQRSFGFSSCCSTSLASITQSRLRPAACVKRVLPPFVGWAQYRKATSQTLQLVCAGQTVTDDPQNLRIALSRACLVSLGLSTRFFYAFGNQPPDYLLSGVLPDEPVAQVLCLASGDLRSVLYSIWREGASSSPQRLEFTLDDSDPRVVARNLLLLELLLDQDVPIAIVWAAWYSLWLNRQQAECLEAATRRLAGLGGDKEDLSRHMMVSYGIRVGLRTEADWSAALAVLRCWAEAPRPAAGRLAELRKAEILRRIPDVSKLEGIGSSQVLHDILVWEALLMTNSGASEETLTREAEQYWATGTCQDRSVRDRAFDIANLPLTGSVGVLEYSLHYGSFPYSGFPLGSLSANPRDPQPLQTHCLSQLDAWRGSLLKEKGRVSLTFTTQDCLELCQDLRLDGASFRVVSTSNVADHVGLLPLLLATRGLVDFRPGAACGALLTSSLLYLRQADSCAGYLAKHLVLDPALWPSLLGWRCLGFEGDILAPTSSQVQFAALPNPATQIFETNKTRMEARFTWLPAAPSAIPQLSCDTEHGAELAGNVRRLVEACKTQQQLPGLHTRHLGTAIPILARLKEDGGVLGEELETEEVRQLMGLLRGTLDPASFACATMRFPPSLDSAFSAEVEPQPVLRVVVNDKAGIPRQYTCIWLVKDSRGSEVAVRWLCPREVLRGASRVLLTGRLLPLGLSEVEDVELSNVDASSVSALWKCLSVPFRGDGDEQSGGVRTGRKSPNTFLSASEGLAEFRLEMAVNGAWRKHLDNRGTLELEAPGCSNGCTVDVGIKSRRYKTAAKPNQNLLDPRRLSLPCCVDLKGSRLLLSRNTWVVTLVLPKAAYPFESFAIASMWAGDDRVLVANAIPDSGMVRVSGLMLNVNDRYLINNLDVQALPPLTALKQTLMILWQKQEEAYGLSTPELGVSVLILSHGIRQSHITRIPMADVSVCFLTFDILNKVVPHWMHRFRNMGIINCSQPQIDLFRSFFDAFRQQLKNPGTHHSETPAWARPHFKRVLLPPLILPLDIWEKETPVGTPQVKLVLERKEEGDAKVKAGHYAEALICYQGGVGAARTETFADEMQGGELGELLEATIACQLNLAHCCLKLCESGDVQPSHQEALLQEAINSCSFVLNHNPRDSSRVKALYRQGLCFSQLGRWHDAVAVLKSASDLVGGRDPKIEEALCAAVQQVS